MKKFIIASVAALTLISGSAFAGKDDKKNPAQTTFDRDFRGASDVKWTEANDVISASFVLSATRVVAYFSTTGELLGTARTLMFSQLPLTVIRGVNARYTSSPVYDIVEYTSNSETFYHMIVDTKGKKFNLRVSSLGDITVEGKAKN
ncbi:MAG TPA: hypothetical protein VGC95_12480 [Chitinophagaceae bacterium]